MPKLFGDADQLNLVTADTSYIVTSDIPGSKDPGIDMSKVLIRCKSVTLSNLC